MSAGSINSERNSSIELLRIFFSVGVVILHYNLKTIGGGLQYVIPGSINEKYLFFSESVNIAAVNTFVMISGYYSVMNKSSKTLKVFSVLFQTAIFEGIFNIVDIYINGAGRNIVLGFFPTNYYVILYCSMYLIIPFINTGLQKLSRKALIKLGVVLFVLFSCETIVVDYLDSITHYSYAMLSTVGLKGSQNGYTFINFILVYTIGAITHLVNIRIKKSVCVWASVLGIIMVWILAIFDNTNQLPIISWHYNHPVVILIAFFLVNLCTQINTYVTIVNKLSGACFTCFLSHWWFLKFLDIQGAVTGKLWGLILHQLLTGIVLFLGSYVVFCIWSHIWSSIVRFFQMRKLFGKLDILLYSDLN